MDELSRRRFLIASGVTGAAAIAAGGWVFTLRSILDTAADPISAPDTNTLVMVTLYGGNDGLATVIPYADPAYHDLRPDLAYTPDEVLRLDDSLALNPALVGCKRLHDQGRLAIVHGVGYPKPDRSHFRSMDIWQTARPDAPTNTGWLGRWLDAMGGNPRLAVSFEPTLPPLLAGATCVGAAVPMAGVNLPVATNKTALGMLGRASAGEPPMQARAAQAFADLVGVDKMINEVTQPPPTGPPGSSGPGAIGASGRPTATSAAAAPSPNTGSVELNAQLALVARCVESRAATRVFSVSLGGFDLHADERTTQEGLLRSLDGSLTAFADRMARTAAGRRVVIAVYSEFGRRVRANGSHGTDHGTAAPMLLLGGPVRGGYYGAPPNLTDLDSEGDLKSTVDFRDVYATLLERVLDTDADRVLGNWKGRLAGVLP